jgi:hypothetical protein
MGTGASRMMEPLPLADSERLPELVASLLSMKLCKARLVVMPTSKQRPLTEYVPRSIHRT